MFISNAIVTKSVEVEVKGEKYWNVSLEGFNVIPDKNLLSGEGCPEQGKSIKATVSTYYRAGKAPLFFITSWEYL